MTSEVAPLQQAQHKACILVVDDVPEILAILGELLTPRYQVLLAASGSEALALARAEAKPDLILMDVMMPGMSGYAVFQALREDPATSEIPVIFVTAKNHTNDEERGLELGAVDYITKPLRPAIVLARVRAQLELKLARDWLQDKNSLLEAEVERRLHNASQSHVVNIHTLTRLTEIRDAETGLHLLRTQSYLRSLALRLKSHPRFAAFLTPHNLELMIKAAPLHDIGKIGIPDAILQKPGKLTSAEWIIMKSHAIIGAHAIEQAERDTGEPVELLRMAAQIAHYHHEHWDGNGYPAGLAGDAIPIPARLMAVADVFDAMIFRRSYKAAMSFAAARAVIAEGSGSHFDPDIVQAFFDIFDNLCSIAERHRESIATSGNIDRLSEYS